MSKTKEYTQCKLSQDNVEQTVWIPTKLAVVGQYVRIIEDNSLWLVDIAYCKLDANTVEANERDYKNQRKVSDVPKGTFKEGFGCFD